MGRPRLLWLTENYPPNRGGMAQSCDRIVDGLRRKVDVDVAHFTAQSGPCTIEHKRNGRHLRCPVGHDPAHALNLLWTEIEPADGPRPYTHAVAFGGTLPVLAAPVYAAWLGIPLLTLLRGNDFDAAVFNCKRRDTLFEALRRSARVCVVSRDKLHKISSLLPQTSLEWIPNGIDLGNWQAARPDREQAQRWRRELVAPDRRVLGMFGHIKQKKGGLLFLETLLQSGHAARFHLLFVGEVEETVATWLAEHEAEISSTMLPFFDRYDLLPYYLACDLVVIASYYDGMPNVMLEAAALGIPLLAARAGGMADFLVEDRHGLLFRAGDRHGCREAIHRAADASDASLRSMGDACRMLVRERLGHEQEIAAYLKVLEETDHRQTELGQ
jgi:glycogen(starch) synthase